MALLSLKASLRRRRQPPVMLMQMKLLQEWRSREGLRQALGNIGWLGSDRVIRMLGGVIVGTAVARYLGPGQFGILNYAFAIYGLFNLASNLGLDSLIVRDAALHPESESELLGTSFLLKTGASVLTTAAAVLTTWLLHSHDSTVITIVALLSFASISQGFDVVDYFYQAKTRSRLVVIPRTTVFVIASLARLAAIFLHSSLLVFAWIAALEILFAEVGLAIAYFAYTRPRKSWTFRFPRARGLLAESWPLLLATLLIMIYMRTDQIMLGALAGPVAVGQYSAAVKLSEIWYSLPIIICSSVMPRLVPLLRSAPAFYYQRMQRLYDLMACLSLIVALATTFAGPLAVRLLYGASYTPAGAVLVIHIWTGLFVYAGCVSGQQLVQEKLTRIELQRAALGAVVNVVLNYRLIPRYGAVGSAYATLIAQAVAAYFADALDSRTHHMFKMKTRAYLGFWAFSLAPWAGKGQE
jgi:PST family polysaccharide transporter